MKFKILPKLIVLVSLIVVIGCASTQVTTLDSKGLRAIKTWIVEFKYTSGEIQQITGDKEEQKIIDKGKPPRHIQLRDDISFALLTTYKLRIVDSNPEGFIRINPIDLTERYFASLDVYFYKKDNKLLGRVKITNGDRKATVKSDDSFAEYCTEAIYNAIEGIEE